MRHIIVATTMLAVALAVTFAAASVLQGVAVANGPANNEPYVMVETATSPQFIKAAGANNKERLTSQFRDRGVKTPQIGL